MGLREKQQLGSRGDEFQAHNILLIFLLFSLFLTFRMLAERRQKVNYVLNPRNNSWAADESNFGKKLMEKMGWSSGKGLGRNEQGNTEHIRVNYKNDSKGMGYSGPVEDPVLHQNDFNELLSQLSQSHEPTPPKPEALSSLEKRSEGTKRRVHYKKFTRGKDLSRYSAKDLECIVGTGKKKKKEETVVEVKKEEDSSKVGEQEHSHGVETIAGGLIGDYFRKKRIERGLQPKVEKDEEEKEEASFGFIGFKMNEEPEETAETEEVGKKKKKKKKAKKSKSEEPEVEAEDVIAEKSDFVEVDEELVEKQEKRKKKKKRKTEEEVAQIEINLEKEGKLKKRKKQKRQNDEDES